MRWAIKATATLLIFVLLAGQAGAALAQFGGLFGGIGGLPVGSKLPVEDKDVKEALLGKQPSLTDPFSGLDKFMKVVDDIRNIQCITAEAGKILSAADDINTWTFGGLSLLGGNATEVSMITGKMKVLNDTKNCVVEKKIKALEKEKPESLLEAQNKQIAMDQLTKEKNTIDLRLDVLNQQLRAAQTALWKGALSATLMTLSKNLAQQMVARLTAKFKISNYMAYADALATQVYNAQYINKNGGSNQERLLAYSLIQNPLAGGKIHPTVRVMAERNLGYSLNNVDYRDPNFNAMLLKAGAAEADPNFMQMVYNNKASEFQAQALAASLREVEMGNGFKTPYSCSGVVGTQLATKQKLDLAGAKLENRVSLFTELDAAKRAGKAVPEKDLQKAWADVRQAQTELEAVPNEVSTPVDEVCKAVVSPAVMIDKAINEAFGAFSEQFKNYNNNNLPYVANAISDIASGLTTNLIFGNAGGVKSTLIAESNKLAAVGDLTTAMASEKYNEQKFASGITFKEPQREPGIGNQWYLTWDVFGVNEAKYTKISGEGLGNNVKFEHDLKMDKMAVRLTKPGVYTYTLQVFSSAKKLLASATQTIKYDFTASQAPSNTAPKDGSTACGGNYASYSACVYEVNDEAYCKSLCSNVLGAFTIRQPSQVKPRGEIEKLDIR